MHRRMMEFYWLYGENITVLPLQYCADSNMKTAVLYKQLMIC